MPFRSRRPARHTSVFSAKAGSTRLGARLDRVELSRGTARCAWERRRGRAPLPGTTMRGGLPTRGRVEAACPVHGYVIAVRLVVPLGMSRRS